jgi:hypothetical protein
MTTANDHTDGPSPIAVLDGRVSDGTDSTPTDLDALYRLLADDRCRRVLRHLWTSDADEHPVPFAELVTRLSQRETDPERRIAAIRLHHADLPKLEAAGVVDVEASEGITLRPVDALYRLLAWIEDVDGPDGARPSLDEWFDLLADVTRRRALELLWQHNALKLSDVADEIAVETHAVPITEIDAETVLETYLSLYHDHVPVMERVGVVAYDQETDTLALDRAAVPTADPLCGNGEPTERR